MSERPHTNPYPDRVLETSSGVPRLVFLSLLAAGCTCANAHVRLFERADADAGSAADSGPVDVVEALDCDDGDECTDDSNRGGVCEHAPNGLYCLCGRVPVPAVGACDASAETYDPGCVYPAPHENYALTFADPLVEDSVRDVLELPAGAIRYGDAALERWREGTHPGARSFSLTHPGVTSLAGIECLRGMTNLDLGRYPTQDGLNLVGSELTDLRAVSYLQSLRTLTIAMGPAIDIEPLGMLTELTTLWIEFGPLEDITPLASLTQLEVLVLNGLRVQDLAPIADLPRLQRLDATGLRRLMSLPDLSALTELTHLDVSSDALTSLYGIQYLSALVTIDASDNRISLLPPFTGMFALEQVYVTRNEIVDASSIGGAPVLNTLDITENPMLECATIEAMRSRVPDLRTDCP